MPTGWDAAKPSKVPATTILPTNINVPKVVGMISERTVGGNQFRQLGRCFLAALMGLFGASIRSLSVVFFGRTSFSEFERSSASNFSLSFVKKSISEERSISRFPPRILSLNFLGFFNDLFLA